MYRTAFLAAFVVMTWGAQALATDYVLGPEHCIDLLDLCSGAEALTVGDLPGGPGTTVELTAQSIEMTWYPGGPRYGEMMLLLNNVRKINGVEVPYEGGSPVDLVQMVLPRGESVCIEYGPTGGRVSAWFMDRGSWDNSGSAVLSVVSGGPSPATALTWGAIKAQYAIQ
jgi:hypothetical protein